MPTLDDPLMIALPDAAATARLGAALSTILRTGDAVLLSGPLGAGKSELARGLVRALTSPKEEVPSPTFTLVQAYETTAGLRLAHLDLYRLKSPEEVDELGLDEALSGGAALIEWPDRMGDAAWLANRLDIEIRPDDAGRIAALVPHGSFKGRTFEY